MSFIEDLQGAIQAAAQKAGPSVVGIGRHQRGSGVVIADGQVLTNAHNLRGDEVTVTFADGHSVVGAVRGVDQDGDLAVIAVETTGAPAIGWSTDALAGSRLGRVRGCRLPIGRRADHPRDRVGHRPGVPGTRRAPDLGQHRAHRAARLRLIRGSAPGRRRPVCRPEHEPDRRGLLPRPAGGCRPAGAGRVTGGWCFGRASPARNCDRPGLRRAAPAPVCRPARPGRPARP